jgi:two-component system CheB/CheR fusion protein
MASVLVVDDDADTTESTRALLQAWGHQAATARDGRSALALAPSFLPDVALVDVRMPRMDGYEVARRLRATPGLKRAVVVALTGWTEPLRPGDEFDFRLLKPVAPDELKLLLDSVASSLTAGCR